MNILNKVVSVYRKWRTPIDPDGKRYYEMYSTISQRFIDLILDIGESIKMIRDTMGDGYYTYPSYELNSLAINSLKNKIVMFKHDLITHGHTTAFLNKFTPYLTISDHLTGLLSQVLVNMEHLHYSSGSKDKMLQQVKGILHDSIPAKCNIGELVKLVNKLEGYQGEDSSTFLLTYINQVKK